MSDRWGAYEDAAKLRERITVIETNLPLMRADMERQLRQLSEGQNANRAYTEDKLNELTQLIKSVTTTKPSSDREFAVMLIIGAIVTVILILIIAYWIWVSTHGQLT